MPVIVKPLYLQLVNGFDACLRLQRPTVSTFTSIIDAFGKAGCLHKAQQVLDHAISLGVHPNAFTFTSLMHTCMRMLDFGAGLRLLGQVGWQ